MFFKFLGFNSFTAVLIFSVVLQAFVFQMVHYFGCLMFLVLELWVFLVIIFFKPISLDITFIFFIFYIILFTSFLISVLILSESQEGFLFLMFLFLMVKVLCFSVLVSIFQDKSLIVFSSPLLVVYLFNFKIFLFLFVLFFLSNPFYVTFLMFLIDFNYLFVLIWVLLLVLIVKSLVSGNLESYVLIVLNFSHFILLSSCFLSVKVLLYCSFLDLLFCFLVVYLINSKSFNFFSNSLGSFTPVFFFMFVCHSFGVPPFPSFFLEVCFFFVVFKSLGYLIGCLFIVLFYLVTVLNFVFVFNALGSSNTPSSPQNLLSDSCFLILVLAIGLFLVCFLSLFNVLSF